MCLDIPKAQREELINIRRDRDEIKEKLIQDEWSEKVNTE